MLLKKPPEFWTNKPLGNPGRFNKAGISLLAATTRGTRYRLIGIGLSDLIDQSSVVKQGDMFSREATDRAETLERAVDDIRARFGEGIVKKGRSLS